MTEINEHLHIFTGSNPNNIIRKTETNEIIMYIIPNIWGKHKSVQGFDFEAVLFKKINIFKWMQIAESIYEGVMEPSYKNTSVKSNRAVHRRKTRGRSVP